MLVHINFHASDCSPILFETEKYDQKDVYIKVCLRNERPVTVKSYSSKSFEISKQDTRGVLLQSDRFITFEFDVGDVSELKLLIQVLLDGECVGHSYVTPVQFLGCSGQIRTALISPNLDFLADISFDYLIIKPWRQQALSNTVADQTYFNGECVYMGHRGRGITTDRREALLENTMDSFLSAHQQGASLVELDVQITKDMVPVIFHDFDASVVMGEKILEVPVKDLTLNQLRTLQMDFARSSAGSHYDDRFQTLFPTLSEFLTNAPESLGVMIEVKYPQLQDDPREWEGGEHFFNRNDVVDSILDVLNDNKGERSIVFASFDPDICLMLQYKQALYQSMLLTCGENDTYSYVDIRTRTRRIAANFALTYDLLGISCWSDPLVNKTDELLELVDLMRSNNKHIITWGEGNSDASFVQSQVMNGVSAVISDALENLNIKQQE